MNFIQGLKRQGRIIFLLAIFLLPTTMSQAQPSIPAGQVDIFMGVDFNYRDLIYNGRVYELLINLTPGVKWNMGKGWQAAAQALVPVVNHYGDRYKRVRLNMAVLSKDAYRHGSATERHATGDHADGFCPEPFCLRQTVWRRFGVGHYV